MSFSAVSETVKVPSLFGGIEWADQETGEPCCADTSPFDRLTGRWWVLHTKVRREKALASSLYQRGIKYFLPLACVKRRYGKRTVEIDLPLFPGYVFLCGEEEDRYMALSTHHVANAIDVVAQETLRAELRQIHHVLESQVPVDLYPGLKAGRRCRITGGSLRGLEGVVLRRRSVSRIYLDVGILGQSAMVEIDASLLEAID